MDMNQHKNSRQIDRRTLLRGTGLALGLPLLESMTPLARSAFANIDKDAAPVRMACIFFPNGAIMPDWKPEGKDQDWKLSRTLAPLQPMKQKLSVISGLAHDNGRAHKDGAGDHARCAAPFLTAARPLKSSSTIRLGVSVDQIAATKLGDQTRLPSIELGLEPSRNAGNCDSGYSCAYSSNISWRNETTPMPKETTPRLAFERMFSGGEAGQRRERNLVRKSILDVVQSDADRLLKRVGETDRRPDVAGPAARATAILFGNTERCGAATQGDMRNPSRPADRQCRCLCCGRRSLRYDRAGLRL